MNLKMTVGMKFTLTCALLLFFTVAMGTVTMLGLWELDRCVQAIVTDSLPGVDRIGRVDSTFQAYKGNAWKHMATTDGKEIAAIEQTMEDLRKEMQSNLSSYSKTITTAEDLALFEKIAPAQERYYRAWAPVQQLSRDLKKKEAISQYLAAVDPQVVSAQVATVALVNWNRENGERNAILAVSASASTRNWTELLLGASILLGSLLTTFIVRNLNLVLRQAVAELRDGADQMASAALQVAGSSQSLAQGSSEQAASIEETSASTEEINSMARRNADHSLAAARLVSSSQQKFVETNELLDHTVAAMSEISSQGDKISKIIKTIDEIAFQTNILALNAAVEAARAGEAGMGFAVVADEVRNLAQRSAQAAKNTAEMIEESIVKSRDGKSKVDRVAASILTVTEQAVAIRNLVEEMNQGSQEQVRGIELIGKAIGEMEVVTQKTAANAEESAAAAEELTAQAETLREILRGLNSMVGGR